MGIILMIGIISTEEQGECGKDNGPGTILVIAGIGTRRTISSTVLKRWVARFWCTAKWVLVGDL